MSEQQSALVEHAIPRTRHRPPPQTPLKHPSEQQSCAFVHATPSTLHNGRQTRFIPMGGGSHRPLQHVVLCVQVVPEAWHAPGVKQTCPMQNPEQQSSPRAQAARAGRHRDASAPSVPASRPPPSEAPPGASSPGAESEPIDPPPAPPIVCPPPEPVDWPPAPPATLASGRPNISPKLTSVEQPERA
jgi:hypothetical protein